MSDIVAFLKQMTDFFKPPMCPIERFILECGKDFKGVKRPKGIRKQRDGACYCNATLLAFENKELAYVEGYAIHDGLFPMLHAWCVTKTGEVVDPTWRYPEKSEYRGVIIPNEVLRVQILKNRVYGVLDTGMMVNLKLIEELRQKELAPNYPLPAIRVHIEILPTAVFAYWWDRNVECLSYLAGRSFGIWE